MKTRNGFVSNSSSSNFCVYGFFVDKKEVLEKLDKILENKVLAYGLSNYDYNRHLYDLWSGCGIDDLGSAEEDSILMGFEVDGATVEKLVELKEKLYSVFGEPVTIPTLHGWGYYDG